MASTQSYKRWCGVRSTHSAVKETTPSEGISRSDTLPVDNITPLYIASTWALLTVTVHLFSLASFICSVAVTSKALLPVAPPAPPPKRRREGLGMQGIPPVPVPGRQPVVGGVGVGVMGMQGMPPVPVPGMQEEPEAVVFIPGMLNDVRAKSSTIAVIQRGQRYQVCDSIRGTIRISVNHVGPS